jgi:hypothetical protein
MDLIGVGYEDVSTRTGHSVSNGVQWWAFVYTLNKIQILKKTVSFLRG